MRFRQSVDGLRPALRGWKLRLQSLAVYALAGLRPALRGWKPSTSLLPSPRNKSPTRLEGMETRITDTSYIGFLGVSIPSRRVGDVT